MTICERVFSLLASDGREQKELANFVGVSTRTVSTWKTRGTNPGAEYIAGIAEFFGVSTDYILTGEERGLHLKDEDVELLGLWDELSKPDRAFIKYEMYRRAGKVEPAPAAGEKEKATEPDGVSIGSVG